jgi:hypothetical protein
MAPKCYQYHNNKTGINWFKKKVAEEQQPFSNNLLSYFILFS